MAPMVAAGAVEQRLCPGCGLALPVSPWAAYEGYYHTSPECWSVYAEVLGREYNDPVLLGGIHSLTVDAFAVQHAGGPQPDESVAIHLAGLYLVLERGMSPRTIPLVQGRLVELVDRWPHFPVPRGRERTTVFDVAACRSNEEYTRTVRTWAAQVWRTWAEHHARIAHLVSRHVPLPVDLHAPGASVGGPGLAVVRD